MTERVVATLGPVSEGERVQELDVVRGFALIGIFLMNIEFFNRSLLAMGDGMPRDLTGANWFASWFITYFVQGKFWTIFSLLFGMGFALMLERAERAGRPFLRPYIRRILGLALFGALHTILLWNGDILFSYAMSATGLLVILYGRARWVAVAVLAIAGIGFVPYLHGAWVVAGVLAFLGMMALYFRGDKRVLGMPLFSFIYMILGILGSVVATLMAVFGTPVEPQIAVSVFAGLFLLVAFLAARYRDPVELRPLRLGAGMYLLPCVMMVAMGIVQYVHTPALTADEQAQQQAAITRQVDRVQEAERVTATGTYIDNVVLRAKAFPTQAVQDVGFSTVAIGMFLIGVWFVRSKRMTNARQHLGMFKKLALYALPLGIGISLLGNLFANSHVPGDDSDGFQLGRALAMLGSLPACLGYVGLLVVALNSNTVANKVRVLAPAGRMALTNYLTQSLVSTCVFYGYGGGYYGLGRAWQVVFVVTVFAFQVAFSHWWLARFRYGPMEWLWRAITYRTIPQMRLHGPQVVAPTIG